MLILLTQLRNQIKMRESEKSVCSSDKNSESSYDDTFRMLIDLIAIVRIHDELENVGWLCEKYWIFMCSQAVLSEIVAAFPCFYVTEITADSVYRLLSSATLQEKNSLLTSLLNRKAII